MTHTGATNLYETNESNNVSAATITIRDNDTNGRTGVLQFSAVSYTVVESNSVATITVTRIGGTTGLLGVTLLTTNGTATPNADYVPTNVTLMWADGEAGPKIMNIPIINDTNVEGNETVILLLSNPTGGAMLGSPSTGTLTIFDDDRPGCNDPDDPDRDCWTTSQECAYGTDPYVPDSYHPADISPPDHEISTREALAYGGAWLRGEIWPVGPNPIPEAFATNGGAIWQRGGCYRFDAAIWPPWVPGCALVRPTHSGGPCYSPGTNTVSCKVSYPDGRRLLSLLWCPVLPAGWTLFGASGDGEPQVGSGKILFTGQLTNNPIMFSYLADVPSSASGPQQLAGVVEYQLEGEINPSTVRATPDPLTFRTHHSADYRDPRSVIDASEANRVLAYWRAGAYRCESAGFDGYAPGTGDCTCPRHSADYRLPYREIDGPEVSRVLAYWRAGCYRCEPAGFDGYAPGCAAAGAAVAGALPPPVDAQSTVVEHGPVWPIGDSRLVVTNRFIYSGRLLSLLWQPQLGPGCTVQSVSGDGNPELVRGEIVWTGATLPPSPIQFIYTLDMPTGECRKEVQAEATFYFDGDVNPTTASAQPNRLALSLVTLAEPLRLENGRFQMTLRGGAACPAVVEASTNLINWTAIATNNLDAEGLWRFIDAEAVSYPHRFYRAK
jgi:hypothetical protein